MDKFTFFFQQQKPGQVNNDQEGLGDAVGPHKRWQTSDQGAGLSCAPKQPYSLAPPAELVGYWSQRNIKNDSTEFPGSTAHLLAPFEDTLPLS